MSRIVNHRGAWRGPGSLALRGMRGGQGSRGDLERWRSGTVGHSVSRPTAASRGYVAPMTDHSEKVDLDARPAAKHGHDPNRVLLLLAGGIPTVATLLAFLGALWWPLDVMANFRFQYAVILLVAVLACLAMLRWRMALLFMLPLILNIAQIAPLYVWPHDVPRSSPATAVIGDGTATTPPPAAVTPSGSPNSAPAAVPVPPPAPLRLMAMSVNVPDRSFEHMIEAIRNAEADVILLQQADAKTLSELEYKVAPFRLIASAPRDDVYGMGLLIRIMMRPPVKIESVRTIDLSDDANRVPAIEAKIIWNGEPVMLLGVNVAPPYQIAEQRTRRLQVASIVRWTNDQTIASVVMGNLNTTPWSASFAHILGSTGLVNSQRGFGMQATWPASGGIPLGEIPIDHCLHTSDLVTLNRKIGPSEGADHRSLIVTIDRINKKPKAN